MYDLFISYSSHDRPWAARLYRDLAELFPTIRVFLDREGIAVGTGRWRTFLTDANVGSTHLAVFWTAKAGASQEVAAEIATFEADVRYAPARGAARRLEFYFPLEGAPGGGLEDLQGFPALAEFYKPEAEDRGVSALEGGKGQLEWTRAVKLIGKGILGADSAHTVIASVVATTTDSFPYLDQVRSLALSPLPESQSLDQFLTQFGLSWDVVKQRYGSTAGRWRPFGGTETVIELLEDLRVRVNSQLEPGAWFRWDHMNLADRDYAANVARLLKEPAVVVVDVVSLYDMKVANAFRGLAEYARKEHSVIVSLAPVGQQGEDWLGLALRAQSVPLMDEDCKPAVPPVSGFARCAISVQRIGEIERLIRGRLGLLHLRAREAEARDITGVAR